MIEKENLECIKLPAFKEYVLVDQSTPIIEVFFKIAENEWRLKSYVGLDKTITLETINVTLKVADIYKKVKNLKDPQFAINFPEEK